MIGGSALEALVRDPWFARMALGAAFWLGAGALLLAASLWRERSGGRGFKKFAIPFGAVGGYYVAQAVGAALLIQAVDSVCGRPGVASC
jgi:hypothetical protein